MARTLRRALGTRRRLVAATVVALMALLAGSAGAGSSSGGSSGVFVFGNGPRVYTVVEASLTGRLAISFHGAQPTCAARGVCGFSGTTVLQPGAGGASALIISSTRHGNRRSTTVSLDLITNDAPTMSTSVRRVLGGAPDGTCVDTSNADGNPTLSQRGAAVVLTAFAADGGLLRSRCAGPLDGDIAPFAPSAALSLSTVQRGHRMVDLRGVRQFSAAGFAGTITSSLVLRLGGSSRQSSMPPASRRTKTTRVRYVRVPLRLRALSGALRAAFSGVSDLDACSVLDSCGLRGSTTITPRRAGSETGELLAYGPASRPLRDFLTALGLRRGGRAKGIFAIGQLDLPSASIETAATQAGPCRDRAAVGAGSLFFFPAPRALAGEARLPPPLHLRCPGPLLGSGQGGLARLSQAPRGLASRRFSLRLTPDWGSADDGYALSGSGAVTLTVTRGGISQHVIRAPVDSTVVTGLGSISSSLR